MTLVTRTSGSATISWEPPVDFGGTEITSYEIAFFTGYEIRAQYKQLVTNVSSKATSLTAKVSALNATTAYGFFVIGVNDISACVDPTVFTSYSILYTTTLTISVPVVPQNLNVTVTTSGMQVISWSPTTDGGGDPAVSYLLYSDTGSLLFNGTHTQFKRGSLVPNTTYGYAVRTRNSVGTSALSPVVRRKTLSRLAVPSAPLDLVAHGNLTGGSISFSWSSPLDSGGEALKGYRIYRDNKLLVQQHPTTAYVDSFNLVAEQEYVYTIQAENSLGVSPQSEALVVHTTAATVPAAPSDLMAIAAGGRLAVSWVPLGDTGGIPLEQYRLRIHTSSVLLLELLLVDTFYEYYGITANTSYRISVAAINGVGTSIEATAYVTNGNAIQPKSPLPPELVSFSAQSIVLALRGPTDDGGSNITVLNLYQDGVQVRSVPSSGYFQVAVGPLFASKVYAFTSTAISIPGLGESPPSAVIEVTTANPTPPSDVYNVAITRRTSDSLDVRWDGPDDIGGENVVYVIECSMKLNSTVATSIETQTQMVTIDGLTPSTSYLVRVRANNSAGTSAWTSLLQGDTDVAQRGTIVVSPMETTIYENCSSLTLQLVRVNGSSSSITCSYTAGNASTAEAGEDYALASEGDRDFTFAEGETLKEFTIQILDNDVYEPTPRQLDIVLVDTTANRSDAVLPVTATIFIQDDGDAGWIDFVDANVSAREGTSNLSIPLRRMYGNSSLASVRVFVYNELNGTAAVPDDFTINTPVVSFADGETNQSASISISDNDDYDFPYKYFILSLAMESGGAQIGANRLVWITIEDDGDESPPGVIVGPTVAKVTGGLIRLEWSKPVNVGGGALWITGYNLTISSDETFDVYFSKGNETDYAFDNLQALTTYTFRIAAINQVGTGKFASAIDQMTTNYTKPGVIPNVSLVSATGGLLTLRISTPIDLGGTWIDKYQVYISSASEMQFEVRVGAAHLCCYCCNQVGVFWLILFIMVRWHM